LHHCHSHKQQKPEDLQKALDDGKKLLDRAGACMLQKLWMTARS
jgi:hypothetical protein